MSFVIICGILWHPVCAHFSVIQIVPRQFCALPSECLALWQHKNLNMSVCHASSVVEMLGAQVTTCQHVMHYICLFSGYYTYFIHIHQLELDFHWYNIHHTQKSKH